MVEAFSVIPKKLQVFPHCVNALTPISLLMQPGFEFDIRTILRRRDGITIYSRLVIKVYNNEVLSIRNYQANEMEGLVKDLGY